MASRDITQNTLKSILHYCPETGIFTWKIRLSNQSNVGTVANSTSKVNGYVSIKYRGYRYLLHRLAFLYMEGSMPPDQVDHINRIRDDNRWCNLRHATHLQNQHNRTDSVDFRGVYWHRRSQRWEAYSQYTNSKNKYLGSFITYYAACYARHACDVLSAT